MTVVLEFLARAYDLGGWVVMILMVIGVITLAVVLYKLWQFSVAGVGRHKAMKQAVAAWDSGDRAGALASIKQSKSYLAPVVEMAFASKPSDYQRLEAEAEASFAKLEGGFRWLDTVAQLAPLLGLFGTVLGMIDAFQALQDAGSQVDPSILAGGIWVALMTTAAGLAVAMPTAMLQSWFESRMDHERVTAEKAISTVLFPQGRTAEAEALMPNAAATSA